ncbi:EKC/KEOPS complex subunit GON7 isoform X2 [Podarcis raffonei]|nr:EKC/KEOPS complex subunit GON7 isoform X2 [Podarcis raffonei]
MELRAELTGRDGLKRPLRVRCEPPGELRGLLSGLAQLREQVSALLGPLVQQESGAGDRAGPGGEEAPDSATRSRLAREERKEASSCFLATKCPFGYLELSSR